MDRTVWRSVYPRAKTAILNAKLCFEWRNFNTESQNRMHKSKFYAFFRSQFGYRHLSFYGEDRVKLWISRTKILLLAESPSCTMLEFIGKRLCSFEIRCFGWIKYLMLPNHHNLTFLKNTLMIIRILHTCACFRSPALWRLAETVKLNWCFSDSRRFYSTYRANTKNLWHLPRW